MNDTIKHTENTIAPLAYSHVLSISFGNVEYKISRLLFYIHRHSFFIQQIYTENRNHQNNILLKNKSPFFPYRGKIEPPGIPGGPTLSKSFSFQTEVMINFALGNGEYACAGGRLLRPR